MAGPYAFKGRPRSRDHNGQDCQVTYSVAGRWIIKNARGRTILTDAPVQSNAGVPDDQSNELGIHVRRCNSFPQPPGTSGHNGHFMVIYFSLEWEQVRFWS